MTKTCRSCALFVGLFAVLTVGAMAFEPTQIPVYVSVAPYAVLQVEQPEVNFGELPGEAGVYHLNGELFRDYLLQVWTNAQKDIRLPGGNQDGRPNLGILTVTSNTAVDVTFTFVPGDNWIAAPTLFGVWNDAPNAGYHNRFFGTADRHNLSTTTRTESGPSTYVVVGGVFIEEVHYVDAGQYEAEIVVTVSKAS